MRILLLISFSFLFLPSSFSQKPVLPEEDMAKLKLYEDTIALLSYAIINDSFPENRFGATKKLIPTLVAALKTPNSFHYPFSRVQSISLQYPADSTFRIFTWQLYVDVNEYRYYGAIQLNNSELKLFPLIDRSFDVKEVEYDVLPPDQWYGALYYNIKPFQTPQGMKYLLFGYDAYSFFNKRKVIDVLSFEGEQPRFGAPVFHASTDDGGTRISNRLLFEYTAEASIKCNFDPVMDMIVVDHLIEVGGMHEGQGPTKIPDGTYEAYQLANGIWQYIPKLDNTIVDEPPRPFPVLESDKELDIFGRKKKG
ncbi:MAG: hypothetical protein WA004_11975 [Saprospiraceae bacterium]